MIFLSLGHSDRPWADFLALLEAQGVVAVADVRRRPRSRRHPWFDGATMAAALAEAGVGYRHFGAALGGWRGTAAGTAHAALPPHWRGYAAHMASAAFQTGLSALLAWAGALSGPVAVMCAEADAARCHRRFIADALVVRGASVWHVQADGGRVAHRLHPALRVDAAGRLCYDRGVNEVLPWSG